MTKGSSQKGGRLVLHACCGPCLIEPYDALAQTADDTVVIYFNPNIQPADEYERRLSTLRSYADAVGMSVVELSYDPQDWSRAVAGHSSRAERCRACYELRLGTVARWAAEHGRDAVATTLTVSPYQDADAIREVGRRVAGELGLSYVDVDFRDRYRSATQRSRDLGMYRQNYCGCLPSRSEAQAERDARKRERAERG